MLTYRYTREGSRLIVHEYEGGRRGHCYTGVMDKGVGVTLYPRKGGYAAESRVPYKRKQINIFMMQRLPDYDAPAPSPIEPPRVTPRTDKPIEPEVLDNSRYAGEQLKLI